MIEIERLEDLLIEHPDLSDSARSWLTNFAVQLMPDFDPVEVRTAEDLNDYVSGHAYAPCPRLGAMVLAAINLDGTDSLDKWLAVTEIVSEADADSLGHIADVCAIVTAAFNQRRNDLAGDVDDSAAAAVSLIAWIWHATLEFYDDAESRRLLEEVFADRPTPPLD